MGGPGQAGRSFVGWFVCVGHQADVGSKPTGVLRCLESHLACYQMPPSLAELTACHCSRAALPSPLPATSGIATSLLFSAFESWLVSEHFKVGGAGLCAG